MLHPRGTISAIKPSPNPDTARKVLQSFPGHFPSVPSELLSERKSNEKSEDVIVQITMTSFSSLWE